VLHNPAAGLFFVHGLLNTIRLGPRARARRSAQCSSPLAPLLRRWRGEGHSGLGMPKIRKTQFARFLRERETFTEKIAWNMLRRHRFLNLKFKRQFVIGNFIVDFYCFEHKLAIEIDGGIHDHQKGYDAWRQAIIEERGFRFVRITTDELLSHPETLLDRIRIALQLFPDTIDLSLSSEAGEGQGVRSVPVTHPISALPSSAPADEAALSQHTL
jgi:very-short-patch-repair endonuclease